MKWHQHSSGEFSATLIPGTAHCGLSYGTGTGMFKFAIDLSYEGEALDSSGFLLDNLSFQTYFQTLPPISVSCELLAKQASEHFLALLGDRHHFVCEVVVAIFPFGETFVSHTLKGSCNGTPSYPTTNI